VYLENKLYSMYMMTGKGFVAFDSFQNCVQLCMNTRENYEMVIHGKKEKLGVFKQASLKTFYPSDILVYI
jgi:hypothetical protein